MCLLDRIRVNPCTRICSLREVSRSGNPLFGDNRNKLWATEIGAQLLVSSGPGRSDHPFVRDHLRNGRIKGLKMRGVQMRLEGGRIIVKLI